ncbi:MAG: hypothetical protein HQK85_12495, partial [Nitrospinae bacterium]|nr:hypothetical protein [Nitrospinota bacterium]
MNNHQGLHLSGEGLLGRARKVALDAMGGDNAPGVNIDGVILALETLQGVDVTLVGDESLLRAELYKRNFSHPAV